MQVHVVMVSWRRTAQVAGVYSNTQQAAAAAKAAKRDYICDSIWVEPHDVDGIAL